MIGIPFGARPASQPAPFLPRHRPKYETAGQDPCGGPRWVRDCACGWRSPVAESEAAANGALEQHKTDAERTAA